MKQNICTNRWALMLILALLVSSSAGAREPVPNVRLTGAISTAGNSAVILPPGYDFQVVAMDQDGPSGLPVSYRYLLKEAVVLGESVNSRYLFESYKDSLIQYDDPQWSEWKAFGLGVDRYPRIELPDLENDTFYILAVQVLDEDGTPNLDFDYGFSAINFRVLEDAFFPVLWVYETLMGGMGLDMGPIEIASGQPLNFSLSASAETYGGSIASFRYGWDVLDPNDPDDPGWAIPPDLNAETIQVPEQVFLMGMHSLVMKAVDSQGQVAIGSLVLTVVPFVNMAYQIPLLMVDQVIDEMSQGWPSSDSSIYFDNAQYRDQYWQKLDGSLGVAGFSWERDHRGEYDQVRFSDIVNYRAVLIIARSHLNQRLFRQFRPEYGHDQYVWLAPYQDRGGNLFLVGDRSMESFLERQSNYMVPIVFDTDEEMMVLDDRNFITGFGVAEESDGTVYNRGTRLYPYLTAGISSLDWAVPRGKFVYGRTSHGVQDRHSSCSGIKAMVLSTEFRAGHQISGSALEDTLWTNTEIDWLDSAGGIADLETYYPFLEDEFVDGNLSSRPWAPEPQECADGVDGLCLEPMYRGVARYDVVRETHWAQGDTGWPESQYDPTELESICGEVALEDYHSPTGQVVPQGTAKTNGEIFGYLSYKNVANKPSGRADVYWGFDPYRFDGAESWESVRWVLDYFGLALHR